MPLKIMVFGTSYDPAPYYVEVPYSGRRILQGFGQGAQDYPTSKLAEDDQKGLTQ